MPHTQSQRPLRAGLCPSAPPVCAASQPSPGTAANPPACPQPCSPGLDQTVQPAPPASGEHRNLPGLPRVVMALGPPSAGIPGPRTHPQSTRNLPRHAQPTVEPAESCTAGDEPRAKDSSPVRQLALGHGLEMGGRPRVRNWRGTDKERCVQGRRQRDADGDGERRALDQKRRNKQQIHAPPPATLATTKHRGRNAHTDNDKYI